MKWWWTYFGNMDEPDKQAQGAERAGYVKVYRKDETDALLAERDSEIVMLKDRCEMHDFFWDGCGFAKRGFKNSIQVSERLEELEAENESLLQQNRELCQALQVMYGKEEYDRQKVKADKLLSCLKCLVTRDIIKDCPEKGVATAIVKEYDNGLG